MITVSMMEAKVHLSRLVDKVAEGQEQEIIIVRDGKPAARIVPLNKSVLGVAKGCIEVPESIDENNDEIARLFSGEDSL